MSGHEGGDQGPGALCAGQPVSGFHLPFLERGGATNGRGLAAGQEVLPVLWVVVEGKLEEGEQKLRSSTRKEVLHERENMAAEDNDSR